MPSRASACPAAAAWRSPRGVSSRFASASREPWGTASPCRRSQSCFATGGEAILPLRMGAIVDTPEEAAALELPPLLIRRPLEAHLDAHGLGTGPVEAAPAVGARRPARGPAARGARRHGGPGAARAAHLRGRVGDRRAVLRDGARRGR